MGASYSVWVFVLGYRYRAHAAVQTVVYLPGAGALPSFRLGPVESAWEEAMPGWPVALDVGVRIMTLDEWRQPARIDGGDGKAVSRLFSPARRAEMGDLSGWVVESQDGDLLLYLPGEVVMGDELPAFLGRAIVIAELLTGPIAGQAARPEGPPPLVQAPPRRQVE